MMMCRSIPGFALTAALLLLGLHTPALAQATGESDRAMMIELRAGFYTPEIDTPFATENGGTGATPYDDVFDSDPMVGFGLHLDYQLVQGGGSLAIGGSASYSWVTGSSLKTDGDGASSDETSLHVVPLRLSLIYRFDYLAIHQNIPIVPYLKAGVTAAIWWVTNGKNEIAGACTDGDITYGEGVTFGYHAAGGVQILLDWLLPGMATTFDAEAGINNTYLFAEYMWSDVNDFHQEDESSLNLRAHVFNAGMMFEF